MSDQPRLKVPILSFVDKTPTPTRLLKVIYFRKDFLVSSNLPKKNPHFCNNFCPSRKRGQIKKLINLQRCFFRIVQIATEAGLRIAPDQWSSLLYGDPVHKSHMQSIIDKLQTPQSFVQSVQELVIALQRTGDPGKNREAFGTLVESLVQMTTFEKPSFHEFSLNWLSYSLTEPR